MSYQKSSIKINPVMNLQDFREYLFERENAPSTIAKYTTDVRTFLRYLGGEYRVDKGITLAYKNWLLENYALSSVNSMLVALNQFLEFLGASTLKVRKVKVQKQTFLPEEKNLTKKEYHRLYRTALDSGKGTLALIMETVASTGIRISELKYFTVDRISKGRIEVVNKGKYRTIFLPGELRKKLIYYVKKHHIKTGCIFVTRNGRPMDRSNLWREMKSLHEEAGVEARKIFPHNFRHLFARLYYKATRDLAGLADILGHSSVEITRIYTMNTGEEYQKKVDCLNIVESGL